MLWAQVERGSSGSSGGMRRASARSLLLGMLLVLAMLLPMAVAVWGLTGFHLPHRQPTAKTRNELLSDPEIRRWLHQLEQEELEVTTLERQDPAIPVRPGESLVQERAQALATWRCLLDAWQAAGGHAEECPAFARYHSLLEAIAPSP